MRTMIDLATRPVAPAPGSAFRLNAGRMSISIFRDVRGSVHEHDAANEAVSVEAPLAGELGDGIRIGKRARRHVGLHICVEAERRQT